MSSPESALSPSCTEPPSRAYRRNVGVLGRAVSSSEDRLPRGDAGRWVEDSREWLRVNQSRGKYRGRNGTDALRFLRSCGRWVGKTPLRVTEDDLWVVVAHVGKADKTRLTYLRLLGRFLAWRGNWVVQQSGVCANFPNRAVNTPVCPVQDRDRVLDAAQGLERVLVSFYSVGRRRVELQRLRVEDLHVDRGTYDIRQKGGRDEVTDRDLPLSDSNYRELGWWLPMRAAWSARASSDTGHVVCRWDRDRLVGVSYQFLDRLLHAAEDRAKTRRWPAHSFRRGAATLLAEREADWEDISQALGHRSRDVTRAYVEPLVRRRRLASALRLIEPPSPAQGGKP